MSYERFIFVGKAHPSRQPWSGIRTGWRIRRRGSYLIRKGIRQGYDEQNSFRPAPAGWEEAYGELVPRREFLYYVGVQCVAAIAWTDNNAPLDNANAFRSKAIHTLREVVHVLQST
ncbi:hypothetical protein GD416_07325 [Burkholderia sp. BE24]|nr:hypothetical protein [Burkholderia sp. BE24]